MVSMVVCSLAFKISMFEPSIFTKLIDHTGNRHRHFLIDLTNSFGLSKKVRPLYENLGKREVVRYKTFLASL